MSAEKQVEAVAAKLKALNPGFDGKITPTIEGGLVVGLQFDTYKVTDISPLRALPGLRVLSCGGGPDKAWLADLSPLKGMKLTDLDCEHSQVSDLSPLKDMKLAWLNCSSTRVTDLSPLKDMKLAWLNFESAPVSDLSPLKDMKLTDLNCGYSQVSDLSPLKGMKLTSLVCWGTKVFDLSPLRGMNLTRLACSHTRVSDLSPLKDMKLTELSCEGASVTDLSPLKGLPLKELDCDFKPERDADILRSIKTLEKINDKPAAEFWKKVEANQAKTAAPPAPASDGFTPLFNGKDLTGWAGLDGFWSVKDGVLSGHETKEGSKQTDLVLTTMRPADFELHYSYKFATPDGNSGVQVRSKVLDEKTYHVGGYQADCDAKGGYDGSIYDEANVAGGRGTMSNRGEKTVWDANNQRHNEKLPESDDDLKKVVKAGDWNDCVIVARGDHITYTINGHLMTDLTDDSPNAVKEGVIALQLHAGFTMEILFKDIKIKVLAPPKSEDEGFTPLFNGKDLTGWKTHPKQPGNWRVEKGVLIGSGPATSHLYTERDDYKDFHLRAEARINDGGNSGIFFRTPFGPFDLSPWPLGYEAQINSTQKDPRKTGSLFGRGNFVVIRESPVPPDEWFSLDVIAEGNHIVLKVNGKATADYTDEQRQFTSGHIALQQWLPQTVAEFRKIEIKELK